MRSNLGRKAIIAEFGGKGRIMGKELSPQELARLIWDTKTKLDDPTYNSIGRANLVAYLGERIIANASSVVRLLNSTEQEYLLNNSATFRPSARTRLAEFHDRIEAGDYLTIGNGDDDTVWRGVLLGFSSDGRFFIKQTNTNEVHSFAPEFLMVEWTKAPIEPSADHFERTGYLPRFAAASESL